MKGKGERERGKREEKERRGGDDKKTVEEWKETQRKRERDGRRGGLS